MPTLVSAKNDFGHEDFSLEKLTESFGQTIASITAAELHGFLAYVMRACAEGREYKIYGYKGKQVRDNIHAHDVCALLHQFYLHPRCGEVYNLGGGRGNSVSVMEAIAKAEQLLGKPFRTTYVDQNRQGDHICYISDLTKIKSHFPHWQITRSLDSILEEMATMYLSKQ